MSYFPEPHSHCKNKIEAELDLGNFATKSAPVDLSKLSVVVKKDVDKKTKYDELKKLTILRLMVLASWLKRLTMTQKLLKLKKKILDHNQDKYITTQEFNRLTSKNFGAKLKRANLASKNDMADFVKKQSLMINLKI